MISFRQVFIRYRWKILIWMAVCLAIFTLGGFFAVPPLLKSILTKQLTAALHREVSIGEVRVNPFTLSTTIKGVAVKEPTGPEIFASFEELYLNLEASSLFRWGVVLREIRLTRPFLRMVRRQDQSDNFSDVLESLLAQARAIVKLPRFSLNNIRIIDGGADLQDEPGQTNHTVRELNVGIPFLSNIPANVETFVQPGLSAVINGTQYALQGMSKPFADSQETTLDVNIAGLDLPYYLAYVPKELLTFALPSGRLDAKLTIVFVRQRTGEQRLSVMGDIGLRDLAVDDKQGKPVVRIPTFGVGLASVEPLVLKVHLAGISLQSPELTVRREQTGTTNLEALLPKGVVGKPAAEKASEPPAESLIVDVDEIRIAQGKVLFSDSFTSLPFKTTLEPIDVSVLKLSTRPDATGTYSLRLKTEAKEEVALEGNISLTPLSADGRFSAKSIPLKKYAPYYRDLVPWDVESGTLDISSQYQYAQGEGDPAILASEAAVSLSALRLKERTTDQEFLNIPRLAVKNTALNLSDREVSVGDVSTQQGTILLSRSPEGEVNLVKLLPRASAAVSSLAAGPETAPPAGPSAEPVREWLVKAGAISLSQYRIQVNDQVPREPVDLIIEDLNLKAENLSTAQNQTGKMSLAFRLRRGTFSSEGSVGLAPIAADQQVTLQDLDLGPFQPYLTERVKVTVTDGRTSAHGRLALSMQEPTGLQATYAGNVVLGKFAAIDKASSEDLLKWESLALGDLSVGYNPLRIHAKKVSLANFFARIILQPGGRLNLQDILAQDRQPQPAPSPPAPAKAEMPPQPTSGDTRDIQIDEVTLQGGRIQFSDRSVRPNYSAEMLEIGGRVSDLSSEEASRAEMELRGKLNNSAPLEIAGTINPLKQNLFVDLKARFTGMDLSPTSPYAGKYAGYTIEKGKLSFDLTYKIDKRKLDSENNVFIDQFTFGEKVDSPSATTLPVKLAVALLKDRNGEIHLDLPVSGSLDDPQFSVVNVIPQILGNLITKAVTSPFALLGAGFGGGEGLQYVEFDYGRATIPDEGAKKIDTLATALSEKPSLKLEIAGHVDMEADREGLKQYLLQRKVKAQKLKDLVKTGSGTSVDEVTVAPAEYEEYLTRAYRAETFPKPRNFIGMVKSLPVPEMEKLILTHIEAGDEELRALAAHRANVVKEAILRSGKVEAERLFIVEPKTLAPEKKENLKNSRVEFTIG